MKRLFCPMLMFVCFFYGLAAAKENPMNTLILTIVKVSPAGSITVNIANSSKNPIRIWKESNSWGAARWRIFLIRTERLETFYQNPDQGFTRNIPTFSEIAGGAHIEHKLNLNDGSWRGSEREKIRFGPGDTIIVAYDAPKQYGWPGAPVTIEASNMRVWYGVATAFLTVQ